MCLPAAVNAIGLALNPGSQPLVTYDGYTPQLRTVAMLIFVALEAPNLVSSDLRNHTLPLYFARPIRRIDYPVAKLLAFVLACLAMIEIPLLLLYLGTATQQHTPSQVWEQTLRLGPGLLYGAAWAVLLASIGLLLASSTGKRVFAICAIGIPLFFTWILANVLAHIGTQAFGPASFGQPSALTSLAGLISPFTLLGGVLRWLQAPATLVGPPGGRPFMETTVGSYGPLYGAVFLILTIAAIARPDRPVPEGRCGMTGADKTGIELRGVSRWYGNVVAVNDITMTIGPGVTGLLGPNGAGKTTIMHMIAGFLAPSRGEVIVAGRSSWRNPAMFRQVALVPERDSVYAFLTGAEFVAATARLHGLADPDRAAKRAIDLLDMAEAQDRKISTYSKGMRQRIKVAAALVHDPEVILLDEPFNGMDPRQRLHMMDLLHAQGEQGRVIVFSSHILEEVERLSGIIQVIVGGRLAASGDFRAIRRLMTNRPHVFLLSSSDDRALGSALIGRPAVSAVELTQHGLQVRASDYGTFTREIAGISRDHGIRLTQIRPADESLESVFTYLLAS